MFSFWFIYFRFLMFHRRHCNNHRKPGTCSCNFSPIYIKEILRSGLSFNSFSCCFITPLPSLCPPSENSRGCPIITLSFSFFLLTFMIHYNKSLEILEPKYEKEKQKEKTPENLRIQCDNYWYTIAILFYGSYSKLSSSSSS